MSIGTIPRKILSFNSTYSGYELPDIGLPTSPPIVGVKTHYVSCLVFDENGEVVGEEEQKVEDPVFDEDWVFEPPSFLLYQAQGSTCGGAGDPLCERTYISIHGAYKMEDIQTTLYTPDADAINDPDSPEQERYAGDLELLDTATENELFDLRLETHESLVESLGENYLEKFLIRNEAIRDKYLNESQYLDYLGITTSLTESQHSNVYAYRNEVGGIIEVEPSQDPKDNINMTRFISPVE